MQKIIYGLQWAWKTVAWRTLAELNGESFIDLDDYIVEHKLGWESIWTFIKAHEEEFRQFEFEALQEVLEKGYDVISLWWGTMAFDRNREVLSKFDVLKIFLDVEIEDQIERIFDENASWNENRDIEQDKQAQRKKFEEVREKRYQTYLDNSNTDINTSKRDEINVLDRVTDEIDYYTAMVPLRSEINKIDDKIISRILELDSQLVGNSRLDYKVLWTDKDGVQYISERNIIVRDIGEIKHKYNKSCIDEDRKATVRLKWVERLGWEWWGIIYDDLHTDAVEIEEKCN